MSRCISRRVFLAAAGSLISHYAINDVISAGLDPKAASTLTRTEIPLPERWKPFEPYWKRARNTGYCRVVEIVARDLCGVKELSAATLVGIGRKCRSWTNDGHTTAKKTNL